MIITIDTSGDSYWDVAEKVQVVLQDYGHGDLDGAIECHPDCERLWHFLVDAREALIRLRDFK